ncbi:MAG: transcriptional regulator [Candidatus Nephrothrix sp. EaCA]|nr:MAG: transcriptional regulator [Candidatus Nephrothrix sp. EaCA]
MKIEMITGKTNTGYFAYAEKYAVYTVGKTAEELRPNILEALNLYFEKEGRTISEKDLKITLDLPQFFASCKVIQAKALAERLGMSQNLLEQYISGIKKPSATQKQRILRCVQKIGNELADIRFLM